MVAPVVFIILVVVISISIQHRRRLHWFLSPPGIPALVQ